MFKQVCFKCGRVFTTEVYIDTDKPLCNECFDELKKIDNYDDYLRFQSQLKGGRG